MFMILAVLFIQNYALLFYNIYKMIKKNICASSRVNRTLVLKESATYEYCKLFLLIIGENREILYTCGQFQNTLTK